MDNTRGLLERRYMLENLRGRLVQLQESYAALLQTHLPSGKPKAWPDFLAQFNVLTARYQTCLTEMHRVTRQLQHQIVLPLKPIVDNEAMGLSPDAPPLDSSVIPDVLLRTRLLPDLEKDEQRRRIQAHDNDVAALHGYFQSHPDALAAVSAAAGAATPSAAAEAAAAAATQGVGNRDLQTQLDTVLEADLDNHETVVEFAQDLFADLAGLKKELKKWDPAEQQRMIIDFRRREREEADEMELACVALFSGATALDKEKQARWRMPHIQRNVLAWRQQLLQESNGTKTTDDTTMDIV